MKLIYLFSICIFLFGSCQPPEENPQPNNLSGRWVGMGYQCPFGTFHNEIVEIVQNGTQISATKVTGDPCVPAGSETFKGSFDDEKGSGTVTVRTGNRSSPNCCSAGGTLTLDGCTLKLISNTGGEIVFTRISGDKAIDFDLKNPVPLTPQNNEKTCWAACATMMKSWKDNNVYSISETISSIDAWYYWVWFSNNGLEPDEQATFFKEKMGLASVQFTPSINGIKSLLEQNGPLLIINGDSNLQHARLVTGIHGDGSAECTYLNILDPWKPNVGRIYVQSYTKFTADISKLVGSTSLIPIYHW